MKVLFLGVLFLAIGTIDASPRTQLDELIARAKSLELDTPYVPPPGDPLVHHAAGYAKVMCSAVFMTGLSPDFAAENVGFFTAPCYDPETVDFSDPALPPGMTAEKVHAGIAVAMKQFAERGWEADVGLIRPDETAGPTVERQLASKSYDCVVIGAGVRLPPRGLALFEAVINAVHKAAPGAAIAFNTRPDDSADAAARWLAAGSRAESLGGAG